MGQHFILGLFLFITLHGLLLRRSITTCSRRGADENCNIRNCISTETLYTWTLFYLLLCTDFLLFTYFLLLEILDFLSIIIIVFLHCTCTLGDQLKFRCSLNPFCVTMTNKTLFYTLFYSRGSQRLLAQVIPVN